MSEDNFADLCTQWDKVLSELPKPAPPKQDTNFFIDGPSRDSEDEFDQSWLSYKDEVLTDSVNADGPYHYPQSPQPKPKLSGGNKKDYLANPIHFASVGKDQDVVVSDNFSDGKELRELNDLKKIVEKMERDLHSSEVFGDQSRKKIEKKLNKVREMVEELSQKIVPRSNNES